MTTFSMVLPFISFRLMSVCENSISKEGGCRQGKSISFSQPFFEVVKQSVGLFVGLLKIPFREV